MKPIVYVIVGATATGKTKLAIDIAKALNGEIISADSMQVYREMNIGTAKPTACEMNGVAHYMIDICDPDYSYSVGEYQTRALECINDVLSKNKVPIVAGGSGLYINALTYNLNFIEIPANSEFRQSLEDKTDEELHHLLNLQDYKAAKRIHPKNRKRVIRALELIKFGKPDSYNFNRQNNDYEFKILGLQYPRNILYQRINHRVDKMIDEGLETEARSLFDKYGNTPTAFQGIGYKEFIAYFEKEYNKDFAIDKIKQHSRNLAKRQSTWFKRDNRINWYNINGIYNYNDYILENLKI